MLTLVIIASQWVTCCCHIYCVTIYTLHFLNFLTCDNHFVLTIGAEGLLNHSAIHSIVQYWLSSFSFAGPGRSFLTTG